MGWTLLVQTSTQLRMNVLLWTMAALHRDLSFKIQLRLVLQDHLVLGSASPGLCDWGSLGWLSTLLVLLKCLWPHGLISFFPLSAVD